MKQKLFAWGGDFVIQDVTGGDAFFVDGKTIVHGNQLFFQDMQGHELAYIRQEQFLFRGRSSRSFYQIYRDDAFATMIEKSPISHLRWIFITLADRNLFAEGNFLNHEYAFRRGDRTTVATVSKQGLAWSGSYSVDIPDDEDAVLLLAITVVIDMACHLDDKDRD